MKYNEFDNPREKQQVRPVTTMDPKELGDRIEKAKAKAFKRPEQPDLSQLWAKEKPATEEKVDYANIMFRGKEIDHNSIEYEMQDFSDMIYELHGAKYIDGTDLTDEELQELERTDELTDWVSTDYASSGPDAPDDYPYEEDGMTSADVDRIKNQHFTDKEIKHAYRVLNHPSVKGGNYTAAYNIINRIAPGLADHPDVANALRRANEGFIGKKMEYNDFLQNKLDTAIQEYDTPEKKAERDALMQKYLNKGGKIEKVPTGKTAYKNKELKPAYRKDNGTPTTSPGSDESIGEDAQADELKRWWRNYSKYEGLNGDKLPFGWYMQLVQTGVPTDGMESGEARQAIADQNPKLDPNDAEGLAGSAKEIPGVDFDKADAPITNAMKQELADVMGVDAVGEEEITKAMKMLGVHTGMESVQEDAGEDEKIIEMLRNIKDALDKHPRMSEHPSLVALDQLADDLESGDKPADYESAIKEDGPPFGSGMELVRMAIMRKFITADEWFHLKDKWNAAADEIEQRYGDWPEGEGFGSSDHNFAIKELMGLVGYEFDEQDTSGRFVVTKVPPEIEKAGIRNARMKGEPVKAEGGMPSSIIKHKQKLAHMSDEELADRFKDFDEKKLRQMAWSHGYGNMSSHYLDRVKNHMTSKRTGTTEERGPGFAVRYSLNGKRKVQAYKTEKDAQHRAEILRSMGGVKDVSITKHTLNFKKESAYESKLATMLNQRLK